MSKYNHEQILELYDDQGMTCREIQNLIGCSHRNVAYIVNKHGKSRKKAPRPGIVFKDVLKCDVFDKDFIYYLDGLLISDAGLFVKGTSPTAVYRHSSVNLEWLNDISVIFNQKRINTSFLVDRRKDRRDCHVLSTPVYEEFFNQHRRWYKGNQKIVPKDLNFLDKNFLRNWVYGDGTLSRNSTLRLCTDDFTEEEVDWLISSLNKNLDISFGKVYMGLSKKGKPKFRPTLCVRDGLEKFYEYLGEPIDCFKYKWRKV
jgi:hypothetical protein